MIVISGACYYLIPATMRTT